MRPNDSRTAKLINSGELYNGKLGAAKPDRFYQIRFNQRSSLNVALSGLQADANLALLDRRGKKLGQSAQAGQANESIATTVDPGTYFVRVSRRQGSTRYQLSLTSNVAQEGGLGTRQAIPSIPADPIAQEVLDLTNTYRAQANLSPLRLNAALSAAATAHSQAMAYGDFFSHSGVNGSTLDDRLSTAGYAYDAAGENIAAGLATPTAVVQAWMKSPEHRANILDPDLQEMGLGFCLLDNDTGTTNFRYYWTQDFGIPSA